MQWHPRQMARGAAGRAECRAKLVTLDCRREAVHPSRAPRLKRVPTPAKTRQHDGVSAENDQWHRIRRSPAPYIAIGIHFAHIPAVTAGAIGNLRRGRLTRSHL